MKLQTIKNSIKQGFQGMWRNRTMSIASIGSISAVLMILGIVIILILSINNVVAETKSQFDEIQVYLEDETTEEETNEIEKIIKEDEAIMSYTFESREEALENMKTDWEEDSYLLEDLEINPLPNSYIIKLKDIQYADLVVEKIKDMGGIEDIRYYKDVIDKLMSFANYIRIGGIGIIGVLIVVSIFIISNTIKITLASREREINIMKYVGATNGYIRGPFIIEGILFGLFGALLSIILINYGYEYFFESVNDRLYTILTVYLVPPASLIKDIALISTSIGVGIGALGSIISLKKYLNV